MALGVAQLQASLCQDWGFSGKTTPFTDVLFPDCSHLDKSMGQ